MGADSGTGVTKKGFFQRFIRGIEVVGNKLPHPFWLFVYLALITLFVSWLCARMGVSVTYMAAGRGGAAAKSTTITVINLASYTGMRQLLANFIKTYVGFPPLGLVMVMMLGISMLEQSGFISALMRKTVLGAPSWAVTLVLALVGINSNLASDTGMIFSPTIGAVVFKALGRNPWVGIIIGFAASSGGFTANFFISGTDALLAGITESAAKGMNITAPVHPLINWYFMFVATITLAVATTWVTEKFTVKYLGDNAAPMDSEELAKHAVTPAECRGLRWGGIAFILFLIGLLALTLPQNAFFRGPNGQLLPTSPLLSGVVPILFLLFVVVGVAYGVGSGTIRNKDDIPKMMQKGLIGSLGTLVVVLPAAVFIQLFTDSRLATVIAVKGAVFLKSINFGGIPLLITFILMTTFINLFMSSGSAKWLILAPIFIPMFTVMGFSPALTQAAYRVGDSCTNILSPLNYYAPIILGLLEEYKPKDNTRQIGMGTLLSLAMPYSIVYLIVFGIQLIVWFWLKLPLGPGAPCGM